MEKPPFLLLLTVWKILYLSFLITLKWFLNGGLLVLWEFYLRHFGRWRNSFSSSAWWGKMSSPTFGQYGRRLAMKKILQDLFVC